MTITINIETIATAISQLNISGVRIIDIDNIPDTARLLCPVMIPNVDNPAGFWTDIQMTRASTGGAGSALMDLTYNLHYIYLHCEAKSGTNNYSTHASAIHSLTNILKAIFENDDIDGAVDMVINNIGGVGVFKDPAGIEYVGVMFSLKVTEFIQ